jgi:hypothetical protein
MIDVSRPAAFTLYGNPHASHSEASSSYKNQSLAETHLKNVSDANARLKQ